MKIPLVGIMVGLLASGLMAPSLLAEEPLMRTQGSAEAVVGLARSGDIQAALGQMQVLLEAAKSTYGPAHPALIPLFRNRANLLRQTGPLSGAEADLRWALALQETSLGQEDPSLLPLLMDLAGLQMEQGKTEEAAGSLARAAALRQATQESRPEADKAWRAIQARLKAIQKDWQGAATLLSQDPAATRTQAFALAHRGQLDEAAELFKKDRLARQEQPVLEQIAGMEDEADFEEGRDRAAVALALRIKAASLRAKTLGPDSFEAEPFLFRAGVLYSKLGRFSEAESLLNRSLKLRKKAFGPASPSVAMALQELGRHLRRAKNLSSSTHHFHLALETWKASSGEKSPAYLACLRDSRASLGR